MLLLHLPRMLWLGWTHGWRVVGIFDNLDKHRQQLAPDAFHLSIVATSVDYQGRGGGSLLLRDTLAKLDEDQQEAYLGAYVTC